MAGVDDKVVSLTFDNAQFQQKMEQTLEGLEKLRKSLDLNTAKQGLSDIGAAAKNFDMTPMANGIEGVSAKFAAMATVGITALATLAHQVITTAGVFAKSLTIDPVTAGFGEFELKMGSIQTIMAGSGASLEEVNQKLQELNNYSDKTIYSFKDMTSNIGKFTNAGVSLDKSVAAIQGVANVAALSGANAEEASRGMYNFAQALSAGHVKLMDWKSIELANMATVEFKQQLIDTAVSMGTLTKTADGYKTAQGSFLTTTKGFNESLSDQWLTSEALTDTLGRYSDATTDIGKRATAAAQDVKTFSQMIATMKESVASGWAESFEAIFGNFEEGKQLWTMVNQAFGGIMSASADARNAMLKDWKDLGGRGELLAGFIHLYDGIKSIIIPIREAFREIFPQTTGKELFDLSVRFKEFAQQIKIGGETAERVKRLFKGFFSVFGIAWEVVKGTTRVFFALVGAVWKIISPLFRLISGTGLLGSGLHAILVESGAIKTFFDFLVAVITRTSDVLGAVVSFIVDFILKLSMVTKLLGPLKALGSLIINFVGSLGLFGKVAGFVDSLGDKMLRFVNSLDLLGKATRFIDSVAEKLGDFVTSFDLMSNGSAALSKVAEIFVKVRDAIWTFFSDIDFGPFINTMGQFALSAQAAFGTFVGFILAARDAVWEFFSDLDFGPVFSVIARAAERAGDAIKGFFENFGGGGGSKSKGAENVEKSHVRLIRMSRGIEDTADSAEKGAGIFERLASAIGSLVSNVSTAGGGIFDNLASSLVGIGAALIEGIGQAFSGANLEKLLNVLKTGALGGILYYIIQFFRNGFFGGFLKDIRKSITGALDALTGSLKALQTNIKADTLRKIAIAIGILAIAMIGLSMVDPAALAQGLLGVVAGLSALTAVMVALEKLVGEMSAGKVAAFGFAFAAMAGSMVLMAGAVYLFSRMDPKELAIGMAGVAAALGVMSTAMRIIGDDTSGLIKAGIAMGVMALSLLLLVRTIQKFADIPTSEMAMGLGQMAAGLAVLVASLRLMPKDVEKKSLGILILVFALNSLAKTIQKFDAISWVVIAKGVGSIVFALGLIGTAMRTFPEDMPETAAGLILISGALYIISKVIQDLGEAKLFDLVKGVGALTIMLNVLAGVMTIFDKNNGGLIALVGASAALLILAGAIKVVGEMPFGEAVKGIGLIVVALALVAGVAYFAAAPLAALGIAFGLLGIGLLAAGAGAFLFAQAFRIAAQAGGEGIDFLMDGIRGFIRQIPSLVTAFVHGIIDGFVELGERAPEIITVFENLIRELFAAITRLAPDAAEAITAIIEAFLQVVRESSDDLILTGFTLLMGFLDALAKNTQPMIDAGAEIILGLLQGMEENVPDIIEALVDLIQEVLETVAYELGTLVPTLMIGVGRNFLQGLWDGVTEEVGALGEMFMGIINDIIGFFTSGFGIMSPSTVMMDIGKNIIQGLFNGILAIAEFVKTWFIEFPLKVIGFLGDITRTLWDKGWELISGLLGGIIEKAGELITWYTSLPGKILGWIGNVGEKLLDKGKDLIGGLLKGIENKAKDLWNWWDGLVDGIIDKIGAVGKIGGDLWNIGKEILQGLWNGLKNKWEDVKDWFGDRIDDVKGFFTSGFGILSPSRVFKEYGKNLMAGLFIGLDKEWVHVARWMDSTTSDIKDTTLGAINQTVKAIANGIDNINEFNPTITPVLDLSKIEAESRKIGSLIATSPIEATASLSRAEIISASTSAGDSTDEPSAPIGPTQLNYEQNIYAPTELSTADIYRQTKSQLVLTKEELGI
jgi:tape measure domain-containing protein